MPLKTSVRDERLTMYPVLGARECRGADLAVGALADDVELAFEGEVVGEPGRPRDEHLAHERLAGARRLAEHGVAGRHRAPAEHVQPLGLDHLLEPLLDLPADRGVARQEDDAAAVLPRARQRDAGLAAHLVVEGVRHLDQDAGAVARVDLRAAGAAVVEVLEHLDRLLDDAVRLVPLDVDHEPLAAGVVLVARVIQPLAGRRAQPDRRGRCPVPGRCRRAGGIVLVSAHGRPCLLPAFRIGTVGRRGVLAWGRKPRAAAPLTRSTIVDTTVI
jgi:hypothetical protein